jgi:hypothetical protein
MAIVNEVKPRRDYKKFPFVHNAKVLWIYGSYIERVPEMYDKSYALCRKYVKDHERDACYAKGKLVCVSMLEEQYKRY